MAFQVIKYCARFLFMNIYCPVSTTSDPFDCPIRIGIIVKQ